MNAIDLNTTVGREYCGRPRKRDDDYRALTISIARAIAVAVIFATLGFTEMYGVALYGNPLLNEQNLSATTGVASAEYLPARYPMQLRDFEDQYRGAAR